MNIYTSLIIEVMRTTSRLPASPKYTGRSNERPIATLSLRTLENIKAS